MDVTLKKIGYMYKKFLLLSVTIFLFAHCYSSQDRKQIEPRRYHNHGTNEILTLAPFFSNIDPTHTIWDNISGPLAVSETARDIGYDQDVSATPIIIPGFVSGASYKISSRYIIPFGTILKHSLHRYASIVNTSPSSHKKTGTVISIDKFLVWGGPILHINYYSKITVTRYNTEGMRLEQTSHEHLTERVKISEPFSAGDTVLTALNLMIFDHCEQLVAKAFSKQ